MYLYLDPLRVRTLERLLSRAISEVSADILCRVNKPCLSAYDERKLELLEENQHLLVSMYHEIKLFSNLK